MPETVVILALLARVAELEADLARRHRPPSPAVAERNAEIASLRRGGLIYKEIVRRVNAKYPDAPVTTNYARQIAARKRRPGLAC